MMSWLDIIIEIASAAFFMGLIALIGALVILVVFILPIYLISLVIFRPTKPKQ